MQSMKSGKGNKTIKAALSGLTSGTTYYFRVAASNSVGTSRGLILSFTPGVPPAVSTLAATSVGSTTATLNGNVTANGLPTNAWFEWGTDSALSGAGTTATQSVGSGTTSQPVNAALTGLSTGTTYYYRVAASNGSGTTQGAILSFTPGAEPSVTTKVATFSSETIAALNGDVNPNGFPTNAWFEWGTDPTLTIFSTTSNQNMGSGTGVLSFNESISLSAYETYYFRAAASNSWGTQKGAIKSFETGVRYVAIGDSITFAGGDEILEDGIGYEPVLGNLLMNNPYTIANAGVNGATSADGADFISTTLSNYPLAQYYLIMYGTNDAGNWGPGYPVPKATYKANMQAIITAIKNDGKIPYLAKVPFVDSSNPNFPAGVNFSDESIQQYNQAIDELIFDNDIWVIPPDFYAWFQSHTSQLQDGIHPTGVGYQSMANLWNSALIE
jgi:lysophospholipase L1-like esterase